MTVKLIINAQDKRIELINMDQLPEAQPSRWHCGGDDFTLFTRFDRETSHDIFEHIFIDTDLEGFVLEMIDHNGVSFMTEVPGLA